ncbi:ABC transporter ATP-binding protein [Candidatus Saccharibacteria bacterium]|nr:MAG: ABC transporter ATP-binding protein [Candidatus Saccharibacteria bacterium]
MQDEGGQILIRVSNLEQSFKIGEEMLKVLHPSSFTIKKNSFNIIYGPSGSGKSTLLNVLSGIQVPSGGQVTYDGRDIYKYSAEQLAYFRAKSIGVVYQQNYWVNSLNVIENVSIPLFFLGYNRAAAAKKAMDALQRVDMAPFAKKSPLMLSGGEQQRIAMARAIVNDPSVIITDEPTGSLDSKNGDMIMALLESYQRDLNRTIILVTHNMEYLPLADQLVHIQDGQCQQMQSGDISETTETLLNQMKARIDHLARKKQDA